MTAPYRVYKVTEVPVSPQPNAVYFVKEASGTKRIIVTSASATVTDFSGGGSAGGGSTAYVHTQNSSASLWTISHNLGFRPDVCITTTGGVEILAGEVTHLSVNVLQINFDAGFTGQARCT
jgi:hypothetical protein